MRDPEIFQGGGGQRDNFVFQDGPMPISGI